MRASIRLLLTIVLLLALPLQGFAAATMIGCAPSHRGPGAGGTAHEAHGAQAHGEAHGKVQHEGGCASSHGKCTCSACAACCIGSALTPSVLRLPADLSTHPRPQPARVLPPAFITEGTERPPRHLLA